MPGEVGLLDQLMYMLSSRPTNPELPAAPPLGRQVTRFGPTFDMLLDEMPEILQQMYRDMPLEVGVHQDGGPVVRAENFPGRGRPTRFSIEALADDPASLYNTLAHEGVHEVQEQRPDLVNAPFTGVFGTSMAQREREAYATAGELMRQLMARRMRTPPELRRLLQRTPAPGSVVPGNYRER